MAFRHNIKVLFQHCDPAGIVFYPRYLEMVNETVEAWFSECLGVSFAKLHGEMERAVPTVALQVEFRSAGRHGDELVFVLTPERIGRSSLDISVAAWCGEKLRSTFTATLVFTTRDGGAAKPWPEDLRKALEAEISRETYQ